jgi:mitochondrial fission protein ELM1
MAQDHCLNVWALSDGIPGHVSHTRGLVKALGHLAPTRVDWIEMAMPIGGARYLLRHLLNLTSRPLPPRLVGLFYSLGALPPGAPDVIVSSGGKTTFLNALLARRYGCRNFFAGTLRDLSERNFTAVITPFALPGATRNIVVDLPLTDFDPEEVAASGAAYRRDAELQDEELWALLIGGDGSGYRFRESDWTALSQAVTRLFNNHGKRWLLATSRRTSGAAEEILRAAIPAAALADAAWFSQDKRRVVKPFLGAASRVFCTEDSMSMLGEAVAAGRPVHSLSPADAKPEARARRIIEHLAAQKRIERLALDRLAAGSVEPSPEGLELLTEPPTRRLAEALRPLLSD